MSILNEQCPSCDMYDCVCKQVQEVNERITASIATRKDTATVTVMCDECVDYFSMATKKFNALKSKNKGLYCPDHEEFRTI